jgi:hydrogenase maturation protease
MALPAGKRAKVLVFGIGNPGRRDDGLGPKLVEKIAGAEFPNSLDVSGEFRYQLNVEDALTMKDFDVVVFADASRTGEEPVAMSEVGPAAEIAITTHAMSPASVVALCWELYGHAPRSYLLAIRGYDWDVGEELSSAAERNLEKALDVLGEFIGRLDESIG